MQQTSIQRKHISISHSETRSSKGFLKKGTNILWNLFLLIFMWQPNQYRCQRHFLTGQRCDAICQVAILAGSPRTQETYLEKKLQSKSFCKRLTSHHTGNLSRKSSNQKDPGNVNLTDKLARHGPSQPWKLWYKDLSIKTFRNLTRINSAFIASALESCVCISFWVLWKFKRFHVVGWKDY